LFGFNKSPPPSIEVNAAGARIRVFAQKNTMRTHIGRGQLPRPAACCAKYRYLDRVFTSVVVVLCDRAGVPPLPVIVSV
jgi:hypothetical protein